MKRMLAFLLTVGLIGSLLFLSNRRKTQTSEDAEGTVWRMLDLSRAGNVDGYLECFTGSTRAQLEATAQGMGTAKFAEYLKGSVGKVKGVAVSEVQRPAEGRATLLVEYVYQDQNERQRLNMRREGGIWRIESAQASQLVQPLVPYGKPATDKP